MEPPPGAFTGTVPPVGQPALSGFFPAEFSHAPGSAFPDPVGPLNGGLGLLLTGLTLLGRSVVLTLPRHVELGRSLELQTHVLSCPFDAVVCLGQPPALYSDLVLLRTPKRAYRCPTS